MTISVVIPVLNGERYLAEVLEAISAQTVDEDVELLVIDSGSHDRSVAIARQAGARLIEISQAEFQHGRTRNMAVAETSGRLIAFLTQDATPAATDWLAAYRDVFATHERLAAAYGPHLPRPDANPLMARMLTEFFGAMSPDGEVVIHEPGGSTYLSNSNSCIARSAWEQIPFRELPYAEDQALGADLLAGGWSKAFVPGAAALHSHNYGLVESSRRWFDEYRGLRDSVGETHAPSAGGALSIVAKSVRADRAWLRRDATRGRLNVAVWTMRSVVYHCCRVFFGGLGSHADRLPRWLRSRLSLEGRADGLTARRN